MKITNNNIKNEMSINLINIKKELDINSKRNNDMNSALEKSMSVRIYIYIYMFACVCVCLGVAVLVPTLDPVLLFICLFDVLFLILTFLRKP
jgi:hypothetical protein